MGFNLGEKERRGWGVVGRVAELIVGHSIRSRSPRLEGGTVLELAIADGRGARVVRA